MVFLDRHEAGRFLTVKLTKFKKTNAVVIGIPRGGIEVAYEISSLLNLPLDIAVVKKISSQSNPELALGAVGPNRSFYWELHLIKRMGISSDAQRVLLEEARSKQKLQENLIGSALLTLSLKGRTALLVDDGVATGATAVCAALYLKKQKVESTILAVPVISKETLKDIKKYFDSVIALSVERQFYAVGQFYKQFDQVTDQEVIRLLKRAKKG